MDIWRPSKGSRPLVLEPLPQAKDCQIIRHYREIKRNICRVLRGVNLTVQRNIASVLQIPFDTLFARLRMAVRHLQIKTDVKMAKKKSSGIFFFFLQMFFTSRKCLNSNSRLGRLERRQNNRWVTLGLGSQRIQRRGWLLQVHDGSSGVQLKGPQSP